MQTLEATASVGNERRAIRILHLEDVRLDAELIRTILTSSGVRCDIIVTPRRADFEAAVKDHSFDIILCDHGLPDYDGFSALRFAREYQPTTPVIVLSGVLDESQAVESLKAGATDYILKQRLTRLIPAVERALRESRERSEKRQLELAFLRAQRMDSLGSLAGGVAHDLNNALAPIQMSVEMLKTSADESVRRRYLDVISASTQRATGMVRQILRFARGHGRIGPVGIGGVVREMAKIIQNTFPKSISIFVDVGGAEIWPVQGDATEIHQVLLNLCVNARDAMSGGGILMISAKNVNLDEAEAARLRTVAGRYVRLAVGDTGSGIAPEILPRIFEPFFTTKTHEQGTGLGLSTVAGIVKNHGGCIDVKTAPSQGTEFRVYLPASEVVAEEQPIPPAEAALPVGNGELILVVDDEEAVCELIKSTLESYGYRVITANNGVQGIACFEERRQEIKVLVTDTDMPFMDGLQVIHAIKELKPDLPVIIASGSAGDGAELERLGPGELTHLGKPFSAEQLVLAVGFAVQNAIDD